MVGTGPSWIEQNPCVYRQRWTAIECYLEVMRSDLRRAPSPLSSSCGLLKAKLVNL